MVTHETREEARELLQTREQRDDALGRLRDWCLAAAEWCRRHEFETAEQRFMGYGLMVGAMRNVTGDNLVRLAATIEATRSEFFEGRYGAVAVRERRELAGRQQVGYDFCRADDLPVRGFYVCSECGHDGPPLQRGFILMCRRCAGFDLRARKVSEETG